MVVSARMGKGRKNHKPRSTSTPARAQTVSPVTSSSCAPAAARVPISRKIALQSAAILAVGTALGFIFNAANPIGVRFENPSSSATLHTGPITNLDYITGGYREYQQEELAKPQTPADK